MGGQADLHVHTRASDGTATPEEVVRQALALGLGALGIADHDTTAAVAPALAAARGTALEVVPGVEINTDYGTTEAHVLGYYIRPDAPQLEDRLAALRRGRLTRIETIVRRLDGLGLPVGLDRVLELAGTGSVGRPHVARALVERGYVRDTVEAFERFLAAGKPAYVERTRFTPAEAVALILAAGGVPVLAHPGPANDSLIDQLVGTGLAGIEVYHPDHSPEVVVHLLRLAARRDLLVTGGSDYHAPASSCGATIGSVTVSTVVVDQLRRLAGSIAGRASGEA
ncbi:MAG: PHP domain-containing protein [bacterium]|nr:PHP domain-containing protein [bacterium]